MSVLSSIPVPSTITPTQAQQIAQLPPMGVLQGTTIPIPLGSGVEGLQSINPPFRSNAPAWYTPGIWGTLGCAVPQPGRYLQTNNRIIYDLVNMVGAQVFSTVWQYPDRLFTRFPSMSCLYDMYNLLIIARKRLNDRLVPDNQLPLLPTHAKPAPQMFLVYPTPLYGDLGCVNSWIGDFVMFAQMMQSEAMQHSDNELGFYITQSFFNTCYGYVKYMIVDMATKFFGYTRAAASADTFVLQATDWQNYNPAQYSVSVEGTSSRPPMGYQPTDLDLEPIRGLPIEDVIPFLQPWPDSVLKYASGGIWNASQAPAGQATTASGSPATTATSTQGQTLAQILAAPTTTSSTPATSAPSSAAVVAAGS